MEGKAKSKNRMRLTATCLVFLLLFNSCATIMNAPTTRINVSSDQPIKLVVRGDSYSIKENRTIRVERQKDTLILTATADTLKKVIKLKPINSYYYYVNAGYFGFGFILDHKSPKRYTYQQNVFIDFNSNKTRPDRFPPSHKGQVNLIFSLPYINSFFLQPQDEPSKSNTGFWGLSTGLEYYYSSHKFVNLSASVATDFFVTVPAAVDVRGEYELMRTKYLSLTDNIQFKRFTIGYGINYSQNTWMYSDLRSNDSLLVRKDNVTKSSQSIGLVLNSYFQLGRHFNLGLIYRPTFLNVYPRREIKYEHLVSIDLAWKWRVKK